MAVQVTADIARLLDTLDKSQWSHSTDFGYAAGFHVTTRDDLRAMKMEKHYYSTRTSGSTGEPVTVEKTYWDHIWYVAANIREVRWRKWDVAKNIGVVKPGAKRAVQDSWGIPHAIEPVQGKAYQIGCLSISEIQSWLQEKNPHYLHCPPSIVNQLDLSKAPNLIDCKGTGELGGSMYSSEECGAISIQCPDNPAVQHVMENQIVEVEADGSMLITTVTNPYIRRYRHGDHIELGSCACGRTLPAIQKIYGRVRNMFVLPDGDKKWPLVGSRDYYEKFGIRQYKVVQTSLDSVEIHIVSEPLRDREPALISLVQQWIDSPIQVRVKYVDGFPNYKHEEFVSLVS